MSLSTIAHKLSQGKGKTFPFYNVPSINTGSKTLRESLGLPADDKSVEIIALNGRRGWWRHYDAGEDGDFGLHKIEAWVDAIRLGEGSKEKLPTWRMWRQQRKCGAKCHQQVGQNGKEAEVIDDGEERGTRRCFLHHQQQLQHQREPCNCGNHRQGAAHRSAEGGGCVR